MECDFSLQYGGLAMQLAALVVLGALISWSYRLLEARARARRVAAAIESRTVRTGFITMSRLTQLKGAWSAHHNFRRS